MSFELPATPGKNGKRNLEVPPKGALFYKGVLPNRPDADEQDGDASYERKEMVSEYEGTEDPMEILMRKQEEGTTEEEVEDLRSAVKERGNQSTEELSSMSNSDYFLEDPTFIGQTGGARGEDKKLRNGTERVETSIKQNKATGPFRGQEPKYKNVRRKGEAW